MVIGLTGSFGSGKTTVAKLLRLRGFELIDADRISRDLFSPGTKVYQKTVESFGNGIIKKDKAIDRLKLARLVFQEKKLLHKLNSIVHPEVIRIITDKIGKSSRRFIILDAPLLIEAGLTNLVDKLIVVNINRKEQLHRLLKRTSLNKTEILKRINSQLSLDKKVRLADFVIDNSGTLNQTKRQVKAIRRLLWKN